MFKSVFAKLSVLLVGLFALAACSKEVAVEVTTDYTVEEPQAVIYLVRHAEKLKDQDDPALSPEGERRAQILAIRMMSAYIEEIHSTDYTRTRQTAEPFARQSGLEVQIYDPSDLPAFAAKLKEQGGRHLVVGHSNTTPQLVEALGGEPHGPIYEPTEYDRLYIVTVAQDGSVDTVLERFGTRYEAVEAEAIEEE